MFRSLGSIVTRWPWLWIGGWLLALAILHLSTPNWSTLVSEGELEHLPPDSPSRRANRLYDQAFPKERSESNIVIVLRRPDGRLQPNDYLFMAQALVPALQQDARRFGGVMEPSILQRLERLLLDDSQISKQELEHLSEEGGLTGGAQSTAATDEGEVNVVSVTAPHNSLVGPLLVSNDGQAMLIVMDLTSSFLTSDNEPIINEVEQTLRTLEEADAAPEGLEVHITGSAILGRDVVAAVTKSTDAVQNWTIWLVLLLLLAVFRAPGLALIPLVTLFTAVKISLDFLAALAAGGVVELYDGLQIYATVLIYGAGVDYSMFLISRYREELSHGARVRQGLAIAITKVGFAIVISAGTEIVGLGTLAFAQFGKFSQAGTSIPIGLLITLLASLTLTVALLQVAGRWGFWPQKLAFRGADSNITDNHASDETEQGFSYRAWRYIGRQVSARPLVFLTIAVVTMLPFCVVAVMNDDNLTYDLTSGLPDDSPSLEGNEVLQEHFSRGIIGPITVLLKSEEVDFSSAAGIEQLTRVTESLLNSEAGFEVADLRVLVRPVGTSPRAERFLDLLQKSIPDRWQRLRAQVSANLPEESDEYQLAEEMEEIIINEATAYYVSQDGPHKGRVTRLILILRSDPFSKGSIDNIQEIGRRVESALGPNSSLSLGILGPTAGLSDVRTAAERDRVFMRTYVTTAVFLILVVLLRRFFISIWLVLSVVLTYLTTMGVAHLLFRFVEGDDFAGLQWTVPVLLFTLLMAVGADYNVLLVQRYEEEKRKYGPADGVVRSLAATGGLISGAGVVMAGTFLALNLGGTMSGMQQLGFALAFGVLLDTFLIRPLLVPSFVLLFERWRARILRGSLWQRIRPRLPRLLQPTRGQ